MEAKIEPLRGDPGKFAELAAAHTKRSRGLQAPVAAIEALRWTLDVPFDEAVTRERARFMELLASEQSAAQRHIFFAQLQVPALPPEPKPREIKRAAVIGAGTMGGGISMCFANAGIPVTIVETSREALDRGLATVSKNYENTVKRGGLKADDMQRRVKLMN